mgnify:CR=1 FL=1
MDQWLDLLVQLLLSVGLACSIGAMAVSFSAVREFPWDRGRMAEDSSLLFSMNPPPFIGIRRWLVRTVRRKESSDDDTDCFSSLLKLRSS